MDGTISSSQPDIKEFLRPLLFGLAEEDLDELAQAAVVRSFPVGAIICTRKESQVRLSTLSLRGRRR